MSNPTRMTYAGTTPTSTTTYALFDTTAFGVANLAAMTDNDTFSLALKYGTAGQLKTYNSADRGTNWRQIDDHLLLTPTSTTEYRRDWSGLANYGDWKVEWTNGGTLQSPWILDMALSNKRAEVYEENYVYYANGVMSANITSGGWIDCQDKTLLTIGFEWASTPSGNFVLQGTNDPARTTDIVNLTIPTAALHYTVSAGTIAIVDGTSLNEAITLTGATGTMRLQLTDLPKWCKLVWTNTASGSSTLDAWVTTK